MLAIALVISLYAGWTLVGFSFYRLLKFRVGVRIPLTQAALLAPTLGWAVILSLALAFNRLGMPVRYAGVVACTVPVLVAFIVAINAPPRFPWRAMRGPWGLLAVALTIVGWPMAVYSFNWVAYCNDDMANYCLAAHRFYADGFFRQPTLLELNGSDYSQYYWFMHGPGEVRAGSEIHLATVMSVTGLNGLQAFMPLICGLHLCLVSAIGAVVVGRSRPSRDNCLLAITIAGCAALLVYGTNYQLIAQVGGLALLLAAMCSIDQALIQRVIRKASWTFRDLTVPIVLTGCMLFTYPESLPFLVAGVGGSAALRTALGESPLGRSFRAAVAFLVAVPTCYSEPALSGLGLMVQQARGGSAGSDLDQILFPFYLLPQGLAYFWGGLAIGADSAGILVTDAAILIGGLYLLTCLVIALRRLGQERDPYAITLLAMAALACVFFWKRADFGLYKLAMFATPLAIVVVTPTLKIALAMSPRVGAVLLAMALCPPLLCSYRYVAEGVLAGGRRAEIPGATRLGLVEQLATISREHPKWNAAQNVVGAKFGALATIGVECPVVGGDFFSNIASFAGAGKLAWKAALRADAVHQAESIAVLPKAAITFNNRSVTSVSLLPPIGGEGILFPSDSPFHGDSSKRDSNALVMTAPFPRLCFRASDLGQHFYLPRDRRFVSYYQPEPDVFMGQGMFQACGRYSALRVVSNDSAILVLDASATPVKNASCRFPAFTVSSATATAALVGDFRGSGRVPLALGGLGLSEDGTIVMLDSGITPVRLPTRREGFEGLYGRDVSLDPRWISHFLRSVRLLEHGERPSAPRAVDRFPKDLANPGLYYCGWYEDGWVGESSWVDLSGGDKLRIRGEVPGIPALHDQAVQITIDGIAQPVRHLPSGEFEIRLPLNGLTHIRRISLVFSRSAVLPSPDDRPISARLHSISLGP